MTIHATADSILEKLEMFNGSTWTSPRNELQLFHINQPNIFNQVTKLNKSISSADVNSIDV